MNWTKKPWSRVLKNGLIIEHTSPEYDVAFEQYLFKDDLENDLAVGGVDITGYDHVSTGPIKYWVVDFWGKYKGLQAMFAEKHNVEYESYEIAQVTVDAFLDKIFDLKLFL